MGIGNVGGTGRLGITRGTGGGRPWRFATNRTRLPVLVATSTSGSAYTVSHAEFYTAPYAQKGIKVAIPNFYCPQSGTSPFETLLDAGRVIQGVSVKIGSAFTQLRCAGALSWTFGSEPYVIFEDADIDLPADTRIAIITADYTPIGSRRPLNYVPVPNLVADGAKWTQGSTSQAAYLTSGTVPEAVDGATAIGSAAIVSRGIPATRPTVLILGDSIGDASNHHRYTPFGDRGIRGYIPIGLDDDAGPGRFTYANFSVGSQNLDALADASGAFAYRYQMLADLGVPFTHIICEHGNNSAGTTFATLLAKYEAAWTRLAAFGKPIIQTTMNPKSTAGGNLLFSTVASQTASDVSPSAARWQMRDYLLAGSATQVAGVIDVAPYWSDATAIDKWAAVGPRASTLAADAASNATTISVTGTPPLVGDDIAIGAGAAGVSGRTVRAVSGAGPYTVTLTAALGASYTTGAAVVATPTIDGIHPSGTQHVAASQAVIAAKAAGMFG